MPPIKHKYVQSSVSMDKVPCKYCQQLFTARGIKSHEASCAHRPEKLRRMEEFADAAEEAIAAPMKGAITVISIQVLIINK